MYRVSRVKQSIDYYQFENLHLQFLRWFLRKLIGVDKMNREIAHHSWNTSMIQKLKCFFNKCFNTLISVWSRSNLTTVFYRSDNEQLISKGYTILFLTMTEMIADVANKNGGGAGIFMPFKSFFVHF
jgi:hypothetical protein